MGQVPILAERIVQEKHYKFSDKLITSNKVLMAQSALSERYKFLTLEDEVVRVHNSAREIEDNEKAYIISRLMAKMKLS